MGDIAGEFTESWEGPTNLPTWAQIALPHRAVHRMADLYDAMFPTTYVEQRERLRSTLVLVGAAVQGDARDATQIGSALDAAESSLHNTLEHALHHPLTPAAAFIQAHLVADAANAEVRLIRCAQFGVEGAPPGHLKLQCAAVIAAAHNFAILASGLASQADALRDWNTALDRDRAKLAQMTNAFFWEDDALIPLELLGPAWANGFLPAIGRLSTGTPENEHALRLKIRLVFPDWMDEETAACLIADLYQHLNEYDIACGGTGLSLDSDDWFITIVSAPPQRVL